MRSWFGLGVGAAIVACLATSPPARADSAADQARNNLTIGLVQFPADLHPDMSDSLVKDYVSAVARRPVTGFDRDGHVVCILCTEVPTLANGLARLIDLPATAKLPIRKGMEVTFTLRPDLFWADGVPVTAADVAFAFTVGQAFYPSDSIASCDVIDAHSVRYTLKQVRYDFDRVADPPIAEHVDGPIFKAASGPLDYARKSAFNTAPTNPGLWLGPYRMDSFRPNDEVAFVRNPYWKGRRPDFDRVTMRLIENTSALQANLLAGDIDTVAPGNMGLSLDQAIALSHDDKSQFDVTFQPETASYEHLTLQLDNPILRDARVRQAMAMAIDRKTLVAKLFDNRVQEAHLFKYPGSPPWDSNVRLWSYNPEGSKRLLTEAGYLPGPDGIRVGPAGRRLSLDIVTTSGDRTRELIEQVLQTEMAQVGIELVIVNQPARVMFGDALRKRGFKGTALFMSVPPLDWVPYSSFDGRAIPAKANNWTGTNYSGLDDPILNDALAEARATLDPKVRADAWDRILMRVADDVPEIPLFFATRATVAPKWLTGMVSDTRYGVPTSWIEDWRIK